MHDIESEHVCLSIPLSSALGCQCHIHVEYKSAYLVRCMVSWQPLSRERNRHTRGEDVIGVNIAAHGPLACFQRRGGLGMRARASAPALDTTTQWCNLRRKDKCLGAALLEEPFHTE